MSVVTPERQLTRAEKVTLIRAALEEHPGLTQREVADLIGMKYATLRNLLDDPDGSKQRARRARYRRPCSNCGALMDGSCGYSSCGKTGLCAKCVPVTWTKWARETVVAALQEFARRYGRTPRVTDLSPANARQIARRHKTRSRILAYEAAAARFEEDSCWPSAASVKDVFGSFAAAIDAAGFAPNPRQPHWSRDAIAEALHEHADEQGCVRFIELPHVLRHAIFYYFRGEGFSGALAYAGLTRAPLRNEIVWTRPRIIAALWRHARADGSPPSALDWRSVGEDRPTNRPVIQRFGSWNAAMLAAGFVPRPSTHAPKDDARRGRELAAGVCSAANPA